MQQQILAVCALLGALAGCSSRQQSAPIATRTPIKVAQPRQFDAPSVVAVSGSVVSPENPSSAAFLVSGKVIRVAPREGDYVRKGQVLAAVDPTDYSLGVDAAAGQAAAARAVLQKAESPARPEVLAQARIALDRAQDEYQRMRQLYESKSLAPNDYQKFRAAYEASRQRYDQALAGAQKEDRQQALAVYEQAVAGEQAARKHLSDATLRAPVDGYVAARLVEVGDMAAAGHPVFQLVQLDPVEVSVGVPETDIHLVRTGQKATVRIPALPDDSFSGTVRVINVAADPSTRTYMVRISVANRRRLLRIGMIAEVQIQSDRTSHVMSLPGSAILRDPQGASERLHLLPGPGPRLRPPRRDGHRLRRRSGDQRRTLRK